MYICLDCQTLFAEPEEWEEQHGLDCGPYEQWYGCPQCHGSFTEALKCDSCGEWIENDYIKIGDERYCEYCFDKYSLGDE